MGKPKFSRKKYETPSHPWKEARIKAENELVAKYGLKNKREIWKAETVLRSYRGQARGLLAKISTEDPQMKKEVHQLLSHLTRYSILPLNSTIDDVLALETEDILNRRLQTLTYLKGFASTPKQARQLINHGHIAIAGRNVNVPGYRVTKDEEKDIAYAHDSPLNDQAHPARPSGDFVSKIPPSPVKQVDEPSVPEKKPQARKPGEKPPKKSEEEKPVEQIEKPVDKPIKEPQVKISEKKEEEKPPEKLLEKPKEKKVEKPAVDEDKEKSKSDKEKSVDKNIKSDTTKKIEQNQRKTKESDK